MNNVVSTGFILVLYLLIFNIAEYAYKKDVSLYITRKIVHIGCGILTALLPFYVDYQVAILIGSLFSILVFMTKDKNIFNCIHKNKKEGIGTLLYAPSLTLTAMIFWPINIFIFQASTLILTLSDGIAGLVGKKFGQHEYFITGKKTYEGTAVFFLITIIILSTTIYLSGLDIMQYIHVVFFTSFVLSIIEAIFSKGWDNLLIPISSGVILYVII